MYEGHFFAWLSLCGKVVRYECIECGDHVYEDDFDDHWREHHITTWEMKQELADRGYFIVEETRPAGLSLIKVRYADRIVYVRFTIDPEAMIRKIYSAWRERKGK